MKALILLVLLVAIGLIALMYKREKSLKRMLFSSFILISIVVFAVVGNVMRSIMPLYIGRLMALILSYGGLVIYIIRDKTQWILWGLPLITLSSYLLLAWIGNEHLIWFS